MEKTDKDKPTGERVTPGEIHRARTDPVAAAKDIVEQYDEVFERLSRPAH